MQLTGYVPSLGSNHFSLGATERFHMIAAKFAAAAAAVVVVV